MVADMTDPSKTEPLDLTPTYLLTADDFDEPRFLSKFRNPFRVIFPNPLNWHRAIWARLTKGIRHDRLISNSSPFVRPQLFWNRIDPWRRRYLRLDNWKLLLPTLLIVGGIVVPMCLHKLINENGLTFTPDENNPLIFESLEHLLNSISWSLTPTQLMVIGLATSALLLSTYFVWLNLHRRDKYIVSEFGYPKADQNGGDESLTALSKKSRRLLVTELQHIAGLLSQRQVENVNISREDANAFFVSSPFDQEFFKEMDQIATVEISGTGRFDLVRLSALISRSIARIHIGGNVQRFEDGTISIDVDLRSRNHSTAFESITLDTPIGDTAFDEDTLAPKMREIALRLLISSQQVSGVGDSWEALDHFLKGLEASSRQQWWQAIAHYYKALEIGKQHDTGNLGVIYFHLGSALVFQGRWDEGQRMLLRAEENGPPLPETQYMLALVTLYIYWGKIKDSKTIVEEIERRCDQALKMRSDFPEVYQLKGSLYYRLGRVTDRDGQKAKDGKRLVRFRERIPDVTARDRKKAPYRGKAPEQINYKREYERASASFRTALVQYDRELRRTQVTNSPASSREVTPSNLIRQRMTTAHQLGDSLRGRGLYAEAEQYYLDMQSVIPSNGRNIADLLKNYCNAGQWKKAQEFLYSTALRKEHTRWDADVMIHAGWLLIGGALKLKNSKTKEAHQKDLLARAFGYLDYALYLRPRYTMEWRQTEWLTSFKDLATKFLNKNTLIKELEELSSQLDKELEQNILYSDLCLREFLYGAQTLWHVKKSERPVVNLKVLSASLKGLTEFIKDTTEKTIAPETLVEELNELHIRVKKTAEDAQISNSLRSKLDKFEHCHLYHDFDIFAQPRAELYYLLLWTRMYYLSQNDNLLEIPYKYDFGKKVIKNTPNTHDMREDYFNLRKTVIENERKSRGTEREKGLFRTFQRIDNATELHELWKVSGVLMNENEYKTPAGRIRLDLYLQISMLTARMLAEAEMNDKLRELTKDTCSKLDKFTDIWRQQTYKGTVRRLDNRDTHFTVSPYVFRYQRATMLGWAAHARLNELEHQGAQADRTLLIKAQDYLNQALDNLVSVHPLVMMSRARLLAHEQLYSEAIEVLKKLLDVIAPFDPKQDVGTSLGIPKLTPTSTSERDQLYQLERVCGQQQFHHVVNPTSIHCLIADYAQQMGGSETALKHRNQAIRESAFDDTDLDILLELARQHIALNQYEDALAVVSAARTPRENLIGKSLSVTSRRMPDVLECVIMNLKGEYTQALRQAQNVAKNFVLLIPEDYIQLVEASYPSDKDIEFKNKFEEMTSKLNTQLDDRSQNGFFQNMLSLLSEKIAKLSTQLDHDDRDSSFKNTLSLLSEKTAKLFHDGEYKAPKPLNSFSRQLEAFLMSLNIKKTESEDSRHDIVFPLVFRELFVGNKRYSEVLEKIAVLAQANLNTEAFKALETQLLGVEKEKYERFLKFHTREAVASLEQLAELCNVLAYSRAETGAMYRNEHAMADIGTALFIVLYLSRACNVSDQRKYYDRKIAQYFDTMGWVLYRHTEPKRFPSVISDPLHYIRLSIHYGHTQAVPQYHLAVMLLDNAETQLRTKHSLLYNVQKCLDDAESAIETAFLNDGQKNIYSQLNGLKMRYRKLVLMYQSHSGLSVI